MYISQRIFVKIWNGPNRIRRGQGENWFVDKPWSRKSRVRLPLSIFLFRFALNISFSHIYVIWYIEYQGTQKAYLRVYRTRMLYVIWTQLVICTFASANRTYKDTEQPLFSAAYDWTQNITGCGSSGGGGGNTTTGQQQPSGRSLEAINNHSKANNNLQVDR
jgi:hypothetical protein